MSILAGTFLITKLYSNTVLSSLNARQELRPLAEVTVELGERHMIELPDNGSSQYHASSAAFPLSEVRMSHSQIIVPLF